MSSKTSLYKKHLLAYSHGRYLSPEKSEYIINLWGGKAVTNRGRGFRWRSERAPERRVIYCRVGKALFFVNVFATFWGSSNNMQKKIKKKRKAPHSSMLLTVILPEMEVGKIALSGPLIIREAVANTPLLPARSGNLGNIHDAAHMV